MTADNVRSDAAGRRPSGNNRGRFDPSLNAAILEAALAGLGELGYDRMSMDDIASRARVGKAAIYRRWPSKAAVVAEAIAHWRRRLGSVDAPNTGSLRGDIDALVASVPDFDETALSTVKVVVGAATAAMNDPRVSWGHRPLASVTSPRISVRYFAVASHSAIRGYSGMFLWRPRRAGA